MMDFVIVLLVGVFFFQLYVVVGYIVFFNGYLVFEVEVGVFQGDIVLYLVFQLWFDVDIICLQLDLVFIQQVIFIVKIYLYLYDVMLVGEVGEVELFFGVMMVFVVKLCQLWNCQFCLLIGKGQEV